MTTENLNLTNKMNSIISHIINWFILKQYNGVIDFIGTRKNTKGNKPQDFTLKELLGVNKIQKKKNQTNDHPFKICAYLIYNI